MGMIEIAEGITVKLDTIYCVEQDSIGDIWVYAGTSRWKTSLSYDNILHLINTLYDDEDKKSEAQEAYYRNAGAFAG